MGTVESIAEAVFQAQRSRLRVREHGEVFTPSWLIEAMLDLVKDESERIDSRFLEPACGSGNFLVRVLVRKLATVERKYGRSDFEKRNYALLSLMCTYGIELLEDNVAECRQKLLSLFDGYLGRSLAHDLHQAAEYVLTQNIVHGDAMTMRNSIGAPVTFAEWGYLGKGRFQRRDFRLDTLTRMSAFGECDSLFADLGKHEVFTPAKNYKPMTVKELAV